jgi:hypothetical protein
MHQHGQYCCRISPKVQRYTIMVSSKNSQPIIYGEVRKKTVQWPRYSQRLKWKRNHGRNSKRWLIEAFFFRMNFRQEKGNLGRFVGCSDLWGCLTLESSGCSGRLAAVARPAPRRFLLVWTRGRPVPPHRLVRRAFSSVLVRGPHAD